MADWKPGEPLPESNPWVRRIMVFAAVSAFVTIIFVTQLYTLELIRQSFVAVNDAVADTTGFVSSRILISAQLAGMIIPPALTTLHDSTIWTWISIDLVLVCFLVAPKGDSLLQAIVARAAFLSPASTSVTTTTVAPPDGTTTSTTATVTAPAGQPSPSIPKVEASE